MHEAQRQIAMEGQQSAKQKESYQDTLDSASQAMRELQSQCKSLEELLSVEQLDAKRRQHEHEDAIATLKRSNKEAVARCDALEEKLHKLDLSLTSERITVAQLKDTNEGLELKLQSTVDKLRDTTEELEATSNRSQKHISELRQQIKDSEAQRRALSDREGSSHRELAATLKAAEDTNRMLREDISQIALEVSRAQFFSPYPCGCKATTITDHIYLRVKNIIFIPYHVRNIPQYNRDRKSRKLRKND
mgnify:CR=1 FL=1